MKNYWRSWSSINEIDKIINNLDVKKDPRLGAWIKNKLMKHLKPGLFKFLHCAFLFQPVATYINIPRGVPAPLFKAPTPWHSLPSFLKYLCSLPSFLFHPSSISRYFFRHSPPHPTIMQIPPALTWPTNLSWFKKISKGWIYQFNCCFLSKVNFNLLNSVTPQIGFLNLMEYRIFSG